MSPVSWDIVHGNAMQGDRCDDVSDVNEGLTKHGDLHEAWERAITVSTRIIPVWIQLTRLMFCQQMYPSVN